MRKLLFLCVIACCTLLVRAQNNAAGHPHFDVKFDDLSRTNHKGFADVTALTAAQSAIWSPRGVTNVGEMRRWCIHEIFNYMESQLSFKSVVLEYKITSSFNVNSRDAAAALYYYKLSDLSKSEVIRTMPQLHYLTGQDPDQTVPDAVLEFNMLLDWECDTKAQPIAGRDLFTCGLHELLHSLGISSLMGISASSTPVSLGNNMANGPYSEFDNMLYLDNSSGTKVLNYTVGVGTTINASAANLCNNIVVFKFGSISYLLPVYSPEHYEPGSSFSHVDESRMENEPEIAMVHGLAPNQRVPGLHDFEKLILCQLGYILNGDVFTPPYGCTPFPVGINDNPSAVWDCQATTSMTYEVIDNDLKVGNNNLVIDPAFGNAGVELLNDITGIQVSIQKTTITVTKTQSIIFPSRKLKIKYRHWTQ